MLASRSVNLFLNFAGEVFGKWRNTVEVFLATLSLHLLSQLQLMFHFLLIVFDKCVKVEGVAILKLALVLGSPRDGPKFEFLRTRLFLRGVYLAAISVEILIIYSTYEFNKLINCLKCAFAMYILELWTLKREFDIWVNEIKLML